MIRKDLKILDFKSGKPRLSPESLQRSLIDRITQVANEIHERRQSQASWVLYTGTDGLEHFNNLLDETYLSSTTTLDGVEGQMRLLGIDEVVGEPNALSVRYQFQPRRSLQYLDLDFSITPTGEYTSFSG
ncbi:MAG: hypothetical protein ACXADH_09055 [Candidatus Kariarchaeaceae archaeon]|jgi:hypothetical protein